MSEANFLRLFPEQQGYRFLLVDDAGRPGARRVAAAIEQAAGDLGADAMPDRAAAGGVPRGREHLPLDVPDARRPRAAGRHHRPRRRAAAQRPRAPPRAGAACAPSATARSPLRYHPGGERGTARLGPGGRRDQRVRGDRAGRARARRPAAGDGRRLAAAACGASRRGCYRRSSRRGRRCARRCSSRCGRNRRPSKALTAGRRTSEVGRPQCHADLEALSPCG